MPCIQCNRTVAIDSFFREMIPAPTKVGWVGSGCSIATDPTTELTHFYNITQVYRLGYHVLHNNNYAYCVTLFTNLIINAQKIS